MVSWLETHRINLTSEKGVAFVYEVIACSSVVFCVSLCSDERHIQLR